MGRRPASLRPVCFGGSQMMRRRITLLLATVLTAAAFDFAVAAATGNTGRRVATARAADDGTAVSHRTITLGGKKLTYPARAGFIPLRVSETGELTGEIFFTAYTLDTPAGSTPRPLTFHWGGGPGGAASLS